MGLRPFTGTVRDKSGTLASGRTVQVIRDVDNVCVSKTTTDALGEFTTKAILTEPGTVTTASASVITDSGQTWTVDEFADHYGVLITSGTQQGEWRKIASNTATALTLDSALPGTTSVDDTFEVAALHTLVFSGEADRNALVFAGAMTNSDSVLWTPREITTALWLDAADADTITLNSGNVSQWDDKSTNNRHAAQATSTAQPIYASSVLNGFNVVRFDGTSDWLSGSMVTGESAYSMFAVVKVNADPAASQARSGCWDFSSAEFVSHYPFTNGIIYDNFASSVRHTTVNPAPSLASWRIYNADSAAGNWTSRLDGTQLFTTATNTVGMPSSYAIGRGEDRWLDGDIAEFIVVPSVLSLSDRQKVEGYLAWKWGLEANLPSLHPYKDAAP